MGFTGFNITVPICLLGKSIEGPYQGLRHFQKQVFMWMQGMVLRIQRSNLDSKD